MALLSGAGQGHDRNVLRGGGNKTSECGICTCSSLQLGEQSLGGGIRAGHSSIICSGERLAEAPLLCWGKQCRIKLDLLLQVLGCFLLVAFPVTHWCKWKWGICADLHQLKLWPIPTIPFFCFSKEVGSDLESTDHSCQEEFLNAVEIY